MFGDSTNETGANDGDDVICSQKWMMSLLRIIITKLHQNRLDKENRYNVKVMC